MKCEQCVKENKKSSVQIGVSYRTCAYYPAYYDEDGNLHQHDSNFTATEYTCSNGHEWVAGAEKSACPTCGTDW